MDGLLSSDFNFYYVIVLESSSFSILDQNIDYDKSLVECKITATDYDNDCKKIGLNKVHYDLYKFPVNDKLTIINSKNQFFVGLNYLYASSTLCQNGVYFTDLPFTDISTFEIIQNCDSSPSSFTRFVLLFPDGKIMNIGLE